MDQDTQKRSAELQSEIDALKSAVERIEVKKSVLIVTKADKVAVPFFTTKYPDFVDQYIGVLKLQLSRLELELERL